jgi:hypothetical protein
MLLEIFALIYILLPKYVFSKLFDKYSKESDIKIERDNRTFLIDDYCNIGQSRITINFFKEILNYFNASEFQNNHNNKCLILDEIFNDYYSQFDKILFYNKESYIYFTCPLCKKDFKTDTLMNLHYKLFHMKYNDSLICPGDFCMSINCIRYYDYFYVKKYSKNPQDVKFNRQAIEKDETCTDELIFFYKSNCMKLIEGCFGDNKDKYFKYYKYICKEIKCKNSNNEQIINESDIGDIFRYILMYVFGMLCFIYLLILWLNKFS